MARGMDFFGNLALENRRPFRAGVYATIRRGFALFTQQDIILEANITWRFGQAIRSSFPLDFSSLHYS